MMTSTLLMLTALAASTTRSYSRPSGRVSPDELTEALLALVFHGVAAPATGA